MLRCIAHPTQLHVTNLWYTQINFNNLKIKKSSENRLLSSFCCSSTCPPTKYQALSHAPRHYGAGAGDWVLMTEADLSIEPNTGMCVALHVLPVGVSYHIRACVLCVCTAQGCVCAVTGANLPVAASPEAGSWRRPSVCFVLTSPFANNI